MENKLAINELKEDLYKTLDRNIIWINHADQKAAIIFASMSFLFGGSVFLSDINSRIKGFDYNTFFEIFYVVIAILYGLSFLLTIVYCYFVLTSRLKNNRNDSSIYFSNIALFEQEFFSERMNNLKNSDVVSDLIEQVYITSKIASKKYKYLNVSYVFIIITFITLIFLSVL